MELLWSAKGWRISLPSKPQLIEPWVSRQLMDCKPMRPMDCEPIKPTKVDTEHCHPWARPRLDKACWNLQRLLAERITWSLPCCHCLNRLLVCFLSSSAMAETSHCTRVVQGRVCEMARARSETMSHCFGIAHTAGPDCGVCT